MMKVVVDDEFSLLKLLDRFDIPLGFYGRNGVKRVEDLVAECMSGECTLKIVDAKIRRVISVVRIAVTCGPYRLVEARQVFTDHRGERHRGFAFVSEKIQQDEPVDVAIKRCMKDELGLSCPFASCHIVGQVEELKDSLSYPGLPTQYIFHDVQIELLLSQFREEGYIEEQPDKTTYFEWRDKKDCKY